MVTADDFLDEDDYTVKWEALASSLAGSIVFAWWTGMISATKAIGGAFETLFDGIATIVEYEVDSYLTVVTSLFDQAWTFDTTFGVFQLPVSVVLALVAAGTVALGVRFFA